MTFEELTLATKKLRVLVIGDHYLDRNSIGKYSGYSREIEQKPIFKIHREEYGPGGAGHLAANIAMTGALVSVAGFWGRTETDHNRNILESLFGKLGIDTSCMVEASRTPTYEKMYFEHGDHEIRLDLDPDKVPGDSYQKLLDKLASTSDTFDCVVVADYDETVNGGVCTPEVLRAASNLGKPTFGTSRIHINRFTKFDTLVVNQKELLESSSEGDEATDTCAALLLMNKAASILIVTLSGQGVDIYGKEPGIKLDPRNPAFEKTQVSSLPVEGRIDPCGAGDAFFAWYVAAFMSHILPHQAARFGNAAARAECKILYGASPVSLLDVQLSYTEMLKAEQTQGE